MRPYGIVPTWSAGRLSFKAADNPASAACAAIFTDSSEDEAPVDARARKKTTAEAARSKEILNGCLERFWNDLGKEKYANMRLDAGRVAYTDQICAASERRRHFFCPDGCADRQPSARPSAVPAGCLLATLQPEGDDVRGACWTAPYTVLCKVKDLMADVGMEDAVMSGVSLETVY